MTEPSPDAAPAAGPPNLSLGPEADAAHALARLRAEDGETPFEAGRRLVPGVWFDADPEGRARGRVRMGGGALVDAEIEIDAPARWLSLHVDFGAQDLSRVGIFGVALRVEAPQAVTGRLCLRSGLGEAGGPEGFADAFLPKRVVAAQAPALHLDALDLTSEGQAPLRAPWREVVLFLEPKGQRLRVLDMRIFAI